MTERYLKILRTLERGLALILFAGFLIIIYYAIYPALIVARLEPGMKKETVISVVGKESLWEKSELDLCNNQAWKGNCEQANASNAHTFLIWKLGIDTYLVVGLDSKSTLVFSGIGDT